MSSANTSAVPTWEQWYAAATGMERDLHDAGRRIRRELDAGVERGWAPFEQEALRLYDEQQAGYWPPSTRGVPIPFGEVRMGDVVDLLDDATKDSDASQ